MDILNSKTEQMAKILEFHNTFNQNVKVIIGALVVIGSKKGENGNPIELPTGAEPWGKNTEWRDLEPVSKNAATFIADLGIVRAATAFEDYLAGIESELDRAGVEPALHAHSRLQRVANRSGIDLNNLDDNVGMICFFDTARNCIANQSNRANQELEDLSQSQRFRDILERWPKRVGKWKVSIPDIIKGQTVDWRPRHAILASDAYFKMAIALDRNVVKSLGERGIVNMAAHWTFLADVLAPCLAKIDAHTMVRSQLTNRYGVKGITMPELIEHLRVTGRWARVREAYARMYPLDKPARPKMEARRLMRAARAKRR